MTTARMITLSIIMTPTNKFVIRIYIPSKIIMGYDNIQKLTCQYFFGKKIKKRIRNVRSVFNIRNNTRNLCKGIAKS